MTKNDTVLILQAFDELSDLLTDLMDQNYEDSDIWNVVLNARIHVIHGRTELAMLFKKLLLKGA